MQIEKWQASLLSRKHTFDIPFNCSRLLLRRQSSVSYLGDLDLGARELVTVDHTNLKSRVRSEVFNRAPLGALALVASHGVMGEKGDFTVLAVPIRERLDDIFGFITDFELQITPGNALHTDGDNRLKLLLDDAIEGAWYELSTRENPMAMPYFHKVEVLPSVAGPNEHVIQADVYNHIVFTSDRNRILRIEVTYSNGQTYDYTIDELLLENYSEHPILGFLGHRSQPTPASEINDAYKPVLADSATLVVMNCRNITKIVLHTDGSIVEVTTFGVDSLPA